MLKPTVPIHPSGSGDNDVTGEVTPVPVVLRHGSGKGADAFRRTDDRSPQRMPRPELPGKEVMDQVVGGILDHADLLEDYLPFLFHFIVGKDRVEHDIGQEIHRLGKERFQYLGVIAGMFP